MEVKVKFTYEDYRHMPDDKRYELLEGDLVMAPSPVEYHQRISGNLQFLLQKFVRERNLGFVYDAPLMSSSLRKMSSSPIFSLSPGSAPRLSLPKI